MKTEEAPQSDTRYQEGLQDGVICQRGSRGKITYSRPVPLFIYEPGPKHVLEPRSQVNMGLRSFYKEILNNRWQCGEV